VHVKPVSPFEVHAVLPASILVAFVAFPNRDRRFPVERFYRTHSSPRNTLLEIAEQFPNLPTKMIINDGDPTSGMTFVEQIFADQQQMVELIISQQYTEEEIRNRIYHD
jgi:hypothetical protein